MIKILNVAEKNDAAKSIARILSNNHCITKEGKSVYNKNYEFICKIDNVNCKMTMTSVCGHVSNIEFDDTHRNWNNVDPKSLFTAKINENYLDNNLKIKKNLQNEIMKADKLIIWTDCDREGENIGFEIIRICSAVKKITIKRAKFSEITHRSIFKAINTLVDPDELLNKAVDVRKELDLRIGAAFTRFQTMRLRNLFPNILNETMSYGSCQFPTVGFVVERFKQNQEFKVEMFVKIIMNHTKDKLKTNFYWHRLRLFDHPMCLAIYGYMLQNPISKVTKIESKRKTKWRPLPLETVSFQKLCSRKLYMTAKKGMQIIEKLYNKGFVSYPRTETNIFPDSLNLREAVNHQVSHDQWGDFAINLLNSGLTPRKGTKTDNAHPPIYPLKAPNNLSDDEFKVFELVVRHFLATCHKDAVGQETIMDVNVNIFENFRAKGLIIKEYNYLNVYKYENWKGKSIGDYCTGDTFTPDEIMMCRGETTAPQLLTESDIITLMDKHGIGTDATQAEHIEKIKMRQYVSLYQKIYFIPGKLGMALVESYDQMGIGFAQPMLRADLEKDLQKICDGKKNWKTVLDAQIQFYMDMFGKLVENQHIMDVSVGKYIQSTPQYNNTSNSILQVLGHCNTCDVPINLKKLNINTASYIVTCAGKCKLKCWIPKKISSVSVSNIKCKNKKCQTMNMSCLKMEGKSGVFQRGYGKVMELCIFCEDFKSESIGIKIN